MARAAGAALQRRGKQANMKTRAKIVARTRRTRRGKAEKIRRILRRGGVAVPSARGIFFCSSVFAR